MVLQISVNQLLVVILVGAVAGFLAAHLVSGHGYGVIGDLIVGIIGAVVGYFLLGTLITTYVLTPLNLTEVSILGQIIVAFIGAAILLAVLRLFVRRSRRVR